eukprot:COSAG02_NODE_51317_length_315_cov_0.421296_1_plen_54_part_01
MHRSYVLLVCRKFWFSLIEGANSVVGTFPRVSLHPETVVAARRPHCRVDQVGHP